MIKILFLAANPANMLPLHLDEESRLVDQALRTADFRDRFDLRQHWAVRYGDLQELLLRHRPDIVHFSGHGSAAGELMLQDDYRRTYPVSPETLTRLFGVLKDSVRCVVFNACYSEIQAEAVAAHIDCVVGMSAAISDAAALEFAAAFYQALAYGRSVAAAFDLACNRIDLANLSEADTPKLLAIGIDPAEIVFIETKVETPGGDPSVSTSPTTVSTGGGAYFAGKVEVSGGTIVGRDQSIQGDLVQEGGVNVSTVLAPVHEAVATASLPPTHKSEALQTVRDLEAEVARGERADDSRVARLVDGLADLVPDATSAVISAFASPLLAGVSGPVTSFVLDRLKKSRS